MSLKHYPRVQLAQDIAKALRGESSISDAPNGLFLAAPRRTGKSTFLQRDLKPELERLGVVVVYVDLWSDKKRDPALLIANAIGEVLGQHIGNVAKLATKAGLKEVKLAGVLTVDTSKIGKVDGLTLAQALAKLRETSGKPVALIIDEAQHALTSQDGEDAMTALKSARDQMNVSGINLMIVMSGSDRDKLMRLVNNNKAPFFGSNITAFKELGSDFIAHVAQLIEAEYKSFAPLDRAALMAAFKAFGHRPQFFIAAIGQALSPLTAPEGVRFEDALLQAGKDKVASEEEQMASDYIGLPAAEQVVLWRLLEQGQKFRPYDAVALAFYEEKLGKKLSPAQAQNALDGLRGRNPSMVWKSLRGEYAVDDAAMHHWYDGAVKHGAWPPGGALISDRVVKKKPRK
jgi:hypothetical protein